MTFRVLQLLNCCKPVQVRLIEQSHNSWDTEWVLESLVAEFDKISTNWARCAVLLPQLSYLLSLLERFCFIKISRHWTLHAMRHLNSTHCYYLVYKVKAAGKCVHYILTKCIVWHLCHMAMKRGHWMSRVLREWMFHETIVLGIFSMDFWGKVLSHYNFSVKHYLWCTLLTRENCCSEAN